MATPESSQDNALRAIDSPAAMAALGEKIAGRLRPGEAVCLWGPLGAGKSTLARGLIRALTSEDEEVPSPTFTLVQTYEGDGLTVSHFDLYRLAKASEAYELGLDEALEAGAAVIEWPERLEAALPPDRLDVEIALTGDGGRTVRITPHGTWEGRGLGS